MGIGEGKNMIPVAENVVTSWITSSANSNSISFTTPIQFKPLTVKRVEFHNEIATVVYWSDGTVTRVKIGAGDKFSPEHGLAMAVAKKMYGSYDRFAWSLSKAKHFKNGEKVTNKTKTKGKG